MGTEKQREECFFMISNFLVCDLQLEAIRGGIPERHIAGRRKGKSY
jgi:hypothetical protein